jgi:hypothetical protein
MSNDSTRGRSECHYVSEAVNSLDSQRAMVNKRQVSGSVSRFIGLVSRAIRPIILFPVVALADPVSNHNEPHAGIQAAIDRLHSAGCTRYSITRSGQYVLNSTIDPDAYNLTGNTITIRCLAKVEVVEIVHQLTWQHANSRVDGTQLQLSEVTGYDLEHNGRVIPVGVVTSFTIDNPGDGESSYRIRTCVSDPVCGPWSSYVRL